MSDSPLFEIIKPHKLARKALKLRGFVPISALVELSSMSVDESGAVEVELSFDSDEGFSVATGQVNAALPVSCQRCLEPMVLPLDAKIRLLFIDTQTREGKAVDMEQYQARFEGRYEIYPVQDERVNLYHLIEQELLLTMPIVPAHEDCETAVETLPEVTESDTETTRRENPFSVLGQLKDQLKTSQD